MGEDQAVPLACRLCRLAGPDVTLVVAETGEVVSRSIEELEDVIGRGLETFVEVGDALAEVRDARHYLQFHPTFEEYCTERWGLSRPRAYELINAAEITKAMSAMADTPAPTNERQARSLAPLKDEPEKAAEAMRTASEASGGKVTAKAVADAVKDILPSEIVKAMDKADDAAAIRDLNNKYQPEGFDAEQNQRDTTERGRWSANCREIAGLPGAPEFVKRHRDLLTKRHIDQAERAYAWLDEFLLTYRESE